MRVERVGMFVRATGVVNGNHVAGFGNTHYQAIKNALRADWLRMWRMWLDCIIK